ncbi:hypothetical protein MJM04_34820, partial [Salmonella enterica subsp. enterica serovar Cerro]|nr:hypothetical protein [Salmonella enterica subsp. enterica serovar Cerro]
TDYRDNYDASLLQGVPRSLNRDPLGLTADNLPFHGADIWTLYALCVAWRSLGASPKVIATLPMHSFAVNNYQVLPMLNWNCSAL